MDKLRRSWHEQRAVWRTGVATPDHWASIEGRRKRQRVRKSRRSKRVRRTLELRVVDRDDDDKSVDARGLSDQDEYYAEHECDTIWGDTVVATRREPCASPPVSQLDFEAVARRLPASPPLAPSTPAPASVLTAADTPEPPPVYRHLGFCELTAADTPEPPPVYRQLGFCELTAAETPEPPPVVRQLGFREPVVRHAALPVKELDFQAIELEAAAAKPSARHIALTAYSSASENRIEFEAKSAETMAAQGMSWDPVWVVVYPEGSGLRMDKKLLAGSVLGFADEQLFNYYHATLHDVFELMIERLGVGAAATHVLRSSGCRELPDLRQTLYEANRQRSIEDVCKHGGLYLEICRRSDEIEPIEPSMPASVSVPHRPWFPHRRRYHAPPASPRPQRAARFAPPASHLLPRTAAVLSRESQCPVAPSPHRPPRPITSWPHGTLTAPSPHRPMGASPPHRHIAPSPQRQWVTRGRVCAAVPRALVSFRNTPAPPTA